MTKLLAAIYEHGKFRLIKPVRLREHQQVTLAVAINKDDIPTMLSTKLAEKSKSFQFLDNPQEDTYSLQDGEKV